MSEFKNRVVLVTGAAGALGNAVVDHFSDNGATIAQLDVVGIENSHYAAICDLTNLQSCVKAVTAIIESLGEIDVLANIAGGFTMGEAVHETSDETWDFMLGLNAKSVLNMARAVVPVMLPRQSGKIINIRGSWKLELQVHLEKACKEAAPKQRPRREFRTHQDR